MQGVVRSVSRLILDLYKKLYLIRKSEQAIIDNYASDEMKTPMHMSMGSEAIAVGVCTALSSQDQVFGTYRSHALFLAKGGNLDKFFAEMYGKITGATHGRGGSMHLSEPEVGVLATSAVVASTIPVAVGAAFANKFKKNKKMVAVFFGDGAVDEGAFWESFNMATLMKLSIIFVCEDNGFAVHTRDTMRHGYNNITDVVSKFRCNVFRSASTDCEEIYKLTRNAIGLTRSNGKPSFLHLKYYRYLEHVGVYPDFDKGYRDRAEFEKWLKRDPVAIIRKKLIKTNSLVTVESLEKQIDKQIFDSLKNAQMAKLPNKNDLLTDVFYEKKQKN